MHAIAATVDKYSYMHRIGSDRIGSVLVVIMIRYVYPFDMIVDPAEIISFWHQLDAWLT